MYDYLLFTIGSGQMNRGRGMGFGFFGAVYGIEICNCVQYVKEEIKFQ